MMVLKPRESGCKGTGKGKRRILSIIRAGRSESLLGSFCGSVLYSKRRGQAAFVCIMESLHEVAIDYNEMHEHGRRQRGGSR